MNKNKIFAIFILIAVLITCAGVSFASSDFDSHIQGSDNDDLDYGLDDDLDDEELEDDFDDDSDDSDDEDWDDDSDDWDDDWDDDDWDDDWEYDDIDWEAYYYDDLDFGYWDYDDIDWNETLCNLTIAKRLSFYKNGVPTRFNETDNRTYFKYLLYAKTFSNSYGKHTSDDEEFDNTTDSEYEREYRVSFLAGCMPSVSEDMNKISSCYESPLLKSMDLGDIKEGFALDESQNNETDDDVKSKDINVNVMPESNNILALLALIIICLVAIL